MRRLFPFACFIVLGCGGYADEAAQLKLHKQMGQYRHAVKFAESDHEKNMLWFEKARAAGYADDVKRIEAAYAELETAAAQAVALGSTMPKEKEGKYPRMKADVMKPIQEAVKDYEEKRATYHKLSNTTLEKLQGK